MTDMDNILDEQLADEMVAKNEASAGRFDMVSIGQLNFADYNPRTMSQHEFESLQRSLDEFGIVQTIVVNRRGNTIVGGHARVRAAQALGYTEVPVVWVDLAKNKEIALNVALNKISGEFDTDVLAELLHDLDDEALILTGFDEDELTKLQDGFVDHEEAVEPPPESKTTTYTIEALRTQRGHFKEATGRDDNGFVEWLP